ncbi:MAG TPA: imidazole glycerol phosphate synthase subunit HisH [Mycobacteriales bacterium]|jgi:glutamine amidotransferase|nr:imidazole glycerol phosphate synthase subunit HisH [Mycobacteriales bacterium]HVX69744.1 imidazole glycerol phosphate synthase subunit HisH [Mycobacteriales bacterium]
MSAKPSVVVVDHGSGNLRSAERALARVGADVTVSSDGSVAYDAAGVVLPGVGAFAACMSGVRRVSADSLVRDRLKAARPVLGICVGMQVLYDAGEEHGIRTDGIGVLPGEVTRIDAPILPHMGWNTVEPAADSMLFAGVAGARFYFVHSYGVRPGGSAGETVTVHGEPFVAAVEAGVLSATQFHPEKSGDAGLTLLENWLKTL